MELNEQKYTERQVALFEQIGSEYKTNINKEKIKFNVLFWLLQVVLVGGAIFGFVSSNIFIGAICLAIVVFDVLSVYRKRLDQFKKMEESSDYETGLFAAGKCKKVIGYNKRYVESLKKSTSFISILIIVFGGLMLYQGFTTKGLEASSLKVVEGTLSQNIYDGRDTEGVTDPVNLKAYVVPISQAEDLKFVYAIVPNIENSFKFDEYKNYVSGLDVNTIQNVKLSYLDQNKEGAKEGYMYVFGITINDQEFMNADEAINAYNAMMDKSKLNSMIFGGVLLGAGVVLFAFPYVYKLFTSKKAQEIEVIQLTYTDEEKIQVGEIIEKEKQSREEELAKMKEAREALPIEEQEALLNTVIRTKKKSSSLIINLVIGLLGIGAIVFGLIKELEFKFLMIVLGAILIVISIYSLVDYFMSYFELSGDKLIIHKLTKTNELSVDEIAKIDFTQGNYALIDVLDQPIVYIPASLLNADELIKNLAKRGITTTFDIK